VADNIKFIVVTVAVTSIEIANYTLLCLLLQINVSFQNPLARHLATPCVCADDIIPSKSYPSLHATLMKFILLLLR